MYAIRSYYAFVVPLGLSWGREKFDITALYGLYVPTGTLVDHEGVITSYSIHYTKLYE